MSGADQRGVLRTNAVVREGAEAGRGEAQRERRRHRAGTPAGRLGQPHHRAPRARAQVRTAVIYVLFTI